MFTEILNAINKSKNIIILTHTSSDGDCLGSAYALKLMLASLGKNANVVYEEELKPRICSILYGTEDDINIIPDLVIAVDCSDLGRLGKRIEIFEQCEETMCIDHHPTNQLFAKHNFVNKDAAATAEIIYELAQFMEIPITHEIATNIYVGIAADTGGFSYANTKAHTHSIAAQLLQHGVNNSFINEFLFSSNSYQRLMLIKEALNSLEIYEDGKIALVCITKEQMESTGTMEDDLGGLISFPRSLDTAIISFCFTEREDGIKISMRSDLIDVSALSAKFGGGGHIRASGCTIKRDLQTVKQMIINEAKRCIKLETRNI